MAIVEGDCGLFVSHGYVHFIVVIVQFLDKASIDVGVCLCMDGKIKRWPPMVGNPCPDSFGVDTDGRWSSRNRRRHRQQRYQGGESERREAHLEGEGGPVKKGKRV